jgi:hypothetical protein
VKRWISVAVLVLLAVLTRGLVLIVVFGIPAALDVMIAVNRDRRRKFVPWPLSRRVCRSLFISPPRPAPPVLSAATPHHHHGIWHEHVNGHIPHEHADASPAASGFPPPTGKRNSRYIPNDVKAAAAARDLGRCRQCGSAEDIHFDHVIPWSRGGAAVLENIQLLCGTCNRRKSDRWN